MSWKNFVDETEQMEHFFEYVSATRKVKVLGVTDKRVFAYKKSHNDFKFVTSQKSLSQIEAGEYKIPIWLWLSMIFFFWIPVVQYITDPSYFNLVFLILPIGTFIFCIFYRKFEFIMTAVGCERFSVITRRKSILANIQKFIDEYHSKEPRFRNTAEEYVQSNYFGRLFERFIALVAFIYSPIPIIVDLFLLANPGLIPF